MVCALVPADLGITTAQSVPTVTITPGRTDPYPENEQGSFEVAREDSLGDPVTSGNLTIALTWTQTGRAVEDSSLPSSVTIPDGHASTTFSFDLRNDALPVASRITLSDPGAGDSDGTVTATVAPDSAYSVGSPGSATITVTDDDDPVLALSAGSPVIRYENLGDQTVEVDLVLRTLTYRSRPPDPIGLGIRTVGKSDPDAVSTVTGLPFSAIAATTNTPDGDYFPGQEELQLPAASDPDNPWQTVGSPGAQAWSLQLGSVATLGVELHDNDIAEPPETFAIRPSRHPGTPAEVFAAALGDGFDAPHVTIYDDEIQFDIFAGTDADTVVAEGDDLALYLEAESRWLHACRDSGTVNNVSEMALAFDMELVSASAGHGTDFRFPGSAAADLTTEVVFDDFSVVQGNGNEACRVRAATEVRIETVDDAAVEGPESFTVNLTPGTDPFDRHVEFEFQQLSVTITDDDRELSLSPATVNVAEGAEVTLTVSLTPASSETVSVRYITADREAEAGKDYTRSSRMVTIPAGSTSATITVKTQDDSLNEAGERFVVRLSDPRHAVLSSQASSTITLGDDDPVPSLSVQDTTVTEDTALLLLAVTLSEPSGREVRAQFETSDDTTTAGADYLADPGVISFQPGQTEVKIPLQILDDVQQESDESFFLDLALADGATLARGAALITIRDDDTAAGLGIGNAAATEGTSAVSFTVTLASAIAADVTVDYETVDGSAIAGSDYTETSGTLTIAAGDTSGTIEVPILDDTTDESIETFGLRLSNATNVTAPADPATATITDDDSEPSLSVDDASAPEDGGTLMFTITLSDASGRPVTVKYNTADGSALQPDDYTLTRGALTIPAGETSASISVPLRTDPLTEVDETFELALRDPTHATLGDGGAVGTILDAPYRPPRVRSSRTSPEPAATLEAPKNATLLQTRTFNAGDGAALIDMSTAFAGEDVTYRASSEDTAILAVAITGSDLSLFPLGRGVATVSISATNATGYALQTFRVDVRAARAAPTLASVLDDITLTLASQPRVLDIAGAFAGRVDRYLATPTDETIVTTAVTGSTVTLTPGAVGSTVVTITAQNSRGVALQTLGVTVRTAEP